MRMLKALAAAAAALMTCGAAAAQAPAPAAWNPQPWLEDLAQMRAALETKYANREWLRGELDLDLGALFDRAAAMLPQARGDADAVRLFDRIVQRISDGHVGLSWPRPAPPPAPASGGGAQPPAPPRDAAGLCRAIGYDAARSSAGIARALPGYAPVAEGDVLPAGIVEAAGTRIGVLRIGVFDPQGSPSLCADAVAALAVPLDAPCDGDCANRIVTHAYAALGTAMQARLAELRAAGAELLLVDITGNGGGSEWTEAAARMVTARRLRSAPLGFVRGEHWAGIWGQLADRLRGFAAEEADAADRRRLLAWAAEADAAQAEARRPCDPATGCEWLARAGFATGLVGAADPGAFDGKPWGVWLFNPAQHTYRPGAWDGPVIVLVDQETWSAAEQFAAVLQDNRAAFVLGARTGGAGCGHSWGGTPTVLANSGAVLSVPDCARFRADGSNEVRGILPDLAISWRANDGRALRARLLGEALPEAVARARALHEAAP